MRILNRLYPVLLFMITMSCSDSAYTPMSNSSGGAEELPPPVEEEIITTGGQEIDLSSCTDEICDGLDNDCDGLPDEELLCNCSEDTSCYGGPPLTRGVGECRDGARMCDSTGELWEECEAWTPPEDEVCDERDNDCDGMTDEGTLNACGACGELPEETCDLVDNDCDGVTDEGTLNACGECGPLPEEICDEIDNDCDGSVDEGAMNICGACGSLPEEVCDGTDNDCDGQIDEGTLNACGACGALPEEACDGQDNDCDGQIDEGALNDCGTCGAPPEEVCDLVDNDCDGTVDEQGCVISDIDIDGDCVTVSCPPEAPHPISCDINFRGRDPRGCVAYNPGESSVYLQEGNDCGAGRVTGTLTCSNIQGGRLNAMNCPMNKTDTSYPRRRNRCADTD